MGYIVLGNPETGRALGVTLWESDEMRKLSDSKAGQIRPRVEEATGGTMEPSTTTRFCSTTLERACKGTLTLRQAQKLELTCKHKYG